MGDNTNNNLNNTTPEIESPTTASAPENKSAENMASTSQQQKQPFEQKMEEMMEMLTELSQKVESLIGTQGQSSGQQHNNNSTNDTESSYSRIGVKPDIETLLMTFNNEFDPFGATSTPLYQTATFKQESATEYGRYHYTRNNNPTRDTLEMLLARLDNAYRALCFTSGMAALTAVTHLVKTGQNIVAGEDIYGGSDRLLSEVTEEAGVTVKRVNTADLERMASAIDSNTKLVWLESPTNPRMQISNISKIAAMAHTHGALVLVDNSMMSPILSQPLELGADIVMHSASKFVSGHSDAIAGVLAIKDKSIAEQLYSFQSALGSGLAPFECWLCLRGIKTMALRVMKQQENADKIAKFLSEHKRVKKVYYAGLPMHRGHKLHMSQAKGAGSVLSFLTESVEVSEYVVKNTQYFSTTVSFGSVKSLISMPCFMSHKDIPQEDRKARGLADELIRISVGIENVDDLISDLDRALFYAPKPSALRS